MKPVIDLILFRNKKNLMDCIGKLIRWKRLDFKVQFYVCFFVYFNFIFAERRQLRKEEIQAAQQKEWNFRKQQKEDFFSSVPQYARVDIVQLFELVEFIQKGCFH